MTLNEYVAAKNAIAPFTGDFGGHYDISNSEAERIAERSSTVEEFETIWNNSDWWLDENN